MAETSPEAELLRFDELRLLRCTIPSDVPTSPSPLTQSHHHAVYNFLDTSIDELLQSIEAGHYVTALSSDSVRAVFKFVDSFESYRDNVKCAELFYSNLLRYAVSFMVDDAVDHADSGRRAFFLMAIAVAAFLAFSQSNVTGPKEEFPVLPLGFVDAKAVMGCGVEWEIWGRNQLMSAGADLLGKFSNIQYIVFSRMLLLEIKDVLFRESLSSLSGVRTISWWLARVLLLQQRMLDERSSSLFDLLQVSFRESIQNFGTLEIVRSYWSSNSSNEEALTVVSMLHVEAGIMEHNYGRVDACRLLLKSAEIAAGIQLSVTGALGFRTIHQTEPKAQLVLVANKSASADGITPVSLEQQDDTFHAREEQHDNSEASDILVTPRLLENGANDSLSSDAGSEYLNSVQQIVILVQCLLIENGARHDELQRWEMAPYIEAIDSQRSSNFIIQRFCDILRIRWESSRSRTKERALLMMEKLAHSVYELSPGVTQRISFSYGVVVPTVPALRKEYGELLVSCGLIGEALKIFEDLELWDNLIFCYCLLEKKAAAIELINKRLIEMPRDPRLWCSLGDVTNDDAYYEKALEVSHDRSARAKRSLARSAYNRRDYSKSKLLWESAMALNSMYPDGWFALGAAALKDRDVEKALDGFTRAVQLDPENGEAWNNIACLHKIKKRSKEAFIAFKEALKYKRGSWQLWENYSHVAVDVGNFCQALEAIQKVLDLSGNKRSDPELLDSLMLEIERRKANKCSTSHNFDDNYCANRAPVDSRSTSISVPPSPDLEDNARETNHIIEVFGTILQRIVRNGGGADIWGLYARWHRSKGDLTMCSEALLKQVRSYQGSELWKDIDRFKKFASASLALCEVYMEIASSTGSRRELTAAEMHLNNTIKQAESFSETQEFIDLHACLYAVKDKLDPEWVPLDC